jgi:4-amino-4-deoxy-L-arabinose transferase-like glycosyltransferase
MPFEEKKQSYARYLPALMTLGLLPLGLENALIVLLVIAFSTYFLVARKDRPRLLGSILLSGFLLRVLVAVVDHFWKVFPYTWDDFYTTGMQIKSNLLDGYPLFNGIAESIHVKSYALVNTAMVVLFGDYEILVRILNCFFGTLVAERVYRISKELDDREQAAIIAAALAAFFPSFILFSALNMRDALIFFLSVDMLWRAMLILERRKRLNYFIVLLEIVVLYTLRIQNVLLYAAIFMTFLLLCYYLKSRRRLANAVLLIVLVGISFLLFARGGFALKILEYTTAELQFRATGGSAYLTEVTYTSWLDVMRWVPVRFLYFTFGPFPWEVRNAFMLLGFLESVVILFLAGLFLFSMRRRMNAPKANQTLLLIAFAVVGLAANSIIDSNYGTAIRHKMNYIFVLFVFAAQYLERLRIRLA